MSKKTRKKPSAHPRSKEGASRTPSGGTGRRLWAALFVVAVLVGGVLGWRYWSRPSADRLVSLYVKGAQEAPVQIREFSDYG